MTWRLYAAGAALLALIGAGLWIDRRGYQRGWEAAQDANAAKLAETQRRLFQAADALSQRARELEEARAAQSNLARRLEDEARSDPGAADRVPAADSLRRLERRWGAQGAAASPGGN